MISTGDRRAGQPRTRPGGEPQDRLGDLHQPDALGASRDADFPAQAIRATCAPQDEAERRYRLTSLMLYWPARAHRVRSTGRRGRSAAIQRSRRHRHRAAGGPPPTEWQGNQPHWRTWVSTRPSPSVIPLTSVTVYGQCPAPGSDGTREHGKDCTASDAHNAS
jgi:hypothetical protein